MASDSIRRARANAEVDLRINDDQPASGNVELSDLDMAPTHTVSGRMSPDVRIDDELANPSKEPLIVPGTRPNADLDNPTSHRGPNPRHSEGTSSQSSLRSLDPGWLPPSYTFDGLVTNWWLWELSSWLFAAISMAAMIAVLHYYDNKVPPKWSHCATINTLVSVLATALKVGLLFPVSEAISQLKWSWYRACKRHSDFGKFDEASKGPAGAVVLFGHLKGRDV